MFSRLIRRFRALVQGRALDRELDEELSFHLEMETAHNRELGLPDEEARARAMREFGGVTRTREETREAHGTRMVDDLTRDVRFASRSLARSPAFTLVALVTLALGIGATTAVFSLVDGVLLRPLPYPAPDRLVRVFERSRDTERMNFAGANFYDLRERATTLESVAFFSSFDQTVLGADQPLRLRAAAVSSDFFRVIGVAPAIGRDFTADEGGPGQPSSVVVSHRFWQGALGADPDWNRRVIRLGQAEEPIVGIMPPGFHFPSEVDIWSVRSDDNPHRTAHNWSVVGRLRPGGTPGQLRAEMDPYFAMMKQELGDAIDAEGVTVMPLHQLMARDARTSLLVLMGAVGFVLLVACVNLASASLARGEARQRELAVRTALGAGRGRLVRQLLTENVLLGVAGGVLGMLLAWLLVRGVSVLGSGALPPFAELRLDVRVLGFALVVSLLTGLLIGTAPALLVTRNLRGAIGHGIGGGDKGGRLRARSLLIGAEVAFALALLAGAGLLVRSLRTLLHEDLGFRTEQVLTMDVSLPAPIYRDTAAWYGDRERVSGFFERLLPALRSIPGVQGVGVINQVPLGRGGMSSGFMRNDAESVGGYADYRIVDSAYFSTLGIPIVHGRSFGEADRAGPHVVVINEAMVERYWPGMDPLGDRIRLPGMDAFPEEWMTVIGVVANVRGDAVDQAAEPQMFVPLAQRPERMLHGTTILVRASLPPEALTAALRGSLREVDPNVPVEISTMSALVSRSVAARRFSTVVLGSFAVLALFLAAVGIYGVLAYSVAQRGRELGVRMALGATGAQVRTLVLRDAMRGVLPGVIVGIFGALALSRVLRGMLYGVSESDPLTFMSVAFLLVAVALLASWIPARRATRVNPMVAIRSDG